MIRTTEASITKALEQRFSDHIFASQVKLGSAGSKIIDAVAIKKTWTPITVIGFEIKVSRADFMNDNKYPEYMKACTNFYFVVPNGIVKDYEIPKEVGLMIYYPDSGTVKVKKKAPYLKNEVKTEMLLHIMFWKFEKYNAPKTRQEHLDDLKAKTESMEWGSEIAMRIRDLQQKVQVKNRRDEWFALCEEFEERFGYKPSRWDVMRMIPDDIEAVKDLHMIKHSINQLHELLNREKVKK